MVPLVPRQFVFPLVLVSVSNHSGRVLKLLEIGVYRLFRLEILKQLGESTWEKHGIKRLSQVYFQLAGDFQTIRLTTRDTKTNLVPSKAPVEIARFRVVPGFDRLLKHICTHFDPFTFVRASVRICTTLDCLMKRGFSSATKTLYA
jgi:hypothetical protein